MGTLSEKLCFYFNGTYVSVQAVKSGADVFVST